MQKKVNCGVQHLSLPHNLVIRFLHDYLISFTSLSCTLYVVDLLIISYNKHTWINISVRVLRYHF